MRSAKKSVVAALSVTILLFLSLAGCGPTNGLAPLTGKFLYVSNAGDGTISEYSINTATGALTSVGNFNANAISANAMLYGLAVHPTNEFIYAPDYTSNDVLGLDIGDAAYSGLILAEPNFDVPTGMGPMFVAITPNGKFLYSTNYLYSHFISSSGSGVSEYSINLTPGAPTAINFNNGALTSIGTASSGMRTLPLAMEYRNMLSSQTARWQLTELCFCPRVQARTTSLRRCKAKRLALTRLIPTSEWFTRWRLMVQPAHSLTSEMYRSERQ
jgi:hypothetical protein